MLVGRRIHRQSDLCRVAQQQDPLKVEFREWTDGASEGRYVALTAARQLRQPALDRLTGHLATDFVFERDSRSVVVHSPKSLVVLGSPARWIWRATDRHDADVCHFAAAGIPSRFVDDRNERFEWAWGSEVAKVSFGKFVRRRGVLVLASEG
jgi:hypothetical protein